MSRLFKIGNRTIGSGESIFVIAEAGVNHNGDPVLALDLVDAAKEAGADAVKFQTFRAEELASHDVPQASYQKRSGEKSQYQMLKDLELAEETYERLIGTCRKRGILFLSTPFDVQSLRFLIDLGMSAVKVPSGELTNLPFLRSIAGTGLPVILSTGMSNLTEVRQAVDVILDSGDPPLAILHCTSSYPTPPEAVNLRAIQTLEREFDVPIGFSDHTEGIEIPLAAVGAGAVIVEKHFTLSRNLPGPDQQSSLEPSELAEMVRGIRKIERALGSGEKEPQLCEHEVKHLVRRYLVFARDMREGAVIEKDDLISMRCDGEVYPGEIEDVVGHRLGTSRPSRSPVRREDLQ